jgi:hypothetical protein
MTDGRDASRSEHYRDVAASLRRLARQTQFPDVRRDLFELADSFERMAEFTEKWDAVERQP